MFRQTFRCFSLCPLSLILRTTACDLQSVHTASLRVCAGAGPAAPHQPSPSFHWAKQSQVSQLFLLGGVALLVHCVSLCWSLQCVNGSLYREAQKQT